MNQDYQVSYWYSESLKDWIVEVSPANKPEIIGISREEEQ
jgi:hypothetical protein